MHPHTRTPARTPSTWEDPSLCCSASPFLHPKPSYGPAIPVVLNGLIRHVQLPLLYAVLAGLLRPVYTYLYAWVVHSETLIDATSIVAKYASWVELNDVWFTVGLSLAVSCSYIIGNGIAYVLDT